MFGSVGAGVETGAGAVYNGQVDDRTARASARAGAIESCFHMSSSTHSAIVISLAIACAACGGSLQETLDAGTRRSSDAEPPSDHDPGEDTDGDGLDDAFEIAAGDPTLLDPLRSDTDSDSVLDGEEDPDHDGLTNREELLAHRLGGLIGGEGPHPFRPSLLIELDAMEGRMPSDAVLADAAGAFRALARRNPDGTAGAGLHFYRGQADLALRELTGSFDERARLLSESRGGLEGPHADDLGPRMIHVVVATLRRDIPSRGGEVITDGTGAIDGTGVLIYHDALEAIHPACGGSSGTGARTPPITFEEALASSAAHEIGHILQLGHDTDAGGGTNFWNVMSVPTSCAEAQRRFHGRDNDDPALGNTEAVSSPRFSSAAEALMRFDRKLSVDVSELDDEDGREM